MIFSFLKQFLPFSFVSSKNVSPSSWIKFSNKLIIEVHTTEKIYYENPWTKTIARTKFESVFQNIDLCEKDFSTSVRAWKAFVIY